MATDIYGNKTGNMVLIDASEAKIKISTGKSNANAYAGVPNATHKSTNEALCTNLTISYQQPIQPVLTFGADVVYAKRSPSGTFSFGSLAGSKSVLVKLRTLASKENECTGGSITVQFGTGSSCKDKSSGIKSAIIRDILDGTQSSVTLHGAVANGFTVQGQASDAFFTQNFGGFFHYLK